MIRIESPAPILRLLLLPAVVAGGLALLYAYIPTTPARLGDDQILTRIFLQDRLIQHVEVVAVALHDTRDESCGEQSSISPSEHFLDCPQVSS